MTFRDRFNAALDRNDELTRQLPDPAEDPMPIIDYESAMVTALAGAVNLADALAEQFAYLVAVEKLADRWASSPHQLVQLAADQLRAVLAGES